VGSQDSEGGHDQEPSRLKSLLPTDDDIHRFGLTTEVEDMAITLGPAAAMGQTAQPNPQPTTPDFRLHNHVASALDQKRLTAAIQIFDQGDARSRDRKPGSAVRPAEQLGPAK